MHPFPLTTQRACAHKCLHRQQPCVVRSINLSTSDRHICIKRLHICRASGDEQQQSNQSAELYKGETSDNRAIEKAVEGAGDGDDSDDEEEEKHGLEELGDAFQGQLTELQEKYKAKLAAKLEQDKEQLRRAEEARSGTFNKGKLAYERGRYQESVVLFEKALNDEGWMSRLGGEIQLWLALAYQAVGRDEECIDLYKKIEDTHPLRKVQQQAANLRYILQAPKLERGPDEVVKIPILQVEERKKVPGRRTARPPVPTAVIVKKKKSWEEQFWDDYQPPKWTENRYVWWASGVLGVCLAIYSAIAV